MVEKVAVKGKEFDVPTWVDKDEFVDGLNSDSGSAFSYITECKLFKSEYNEYDSQDSGKEVYDDYFTLSFTVPLGHCAEISYPAFMLNDYLYDGMEPEFTYDAQGVHFKGVFNEYRDFNSIALLSLPFDKKDDLINYLTIGSSEEAYYGVMEQLEEFSYELEAFSDFDKDFKEHMDLTDNFTGRFVVNGEEWIAVALVHAD